MRYRNADVHTRVFPNLVNPKTGTTLELAPGATVDLTEVIEDVHLVPVHEAKKGRAAQEPEPNEAQKEDI